MFSSKNYLSIYVIVEKVPLSIHAVIEHIVFLIHGVVESNMKTLRQNVSVEFWDTLLSKIWSMLSLKFRRSSTQWTFIIHVTVLSNDHHSCFELFHSRSNVEISEKLRQINLKQGNLTSNFHYKLSRKKIVVDHWQDFQPQKKCFSVKLLQLKWAINFRLFSRLNFSIMKQPDPRWWSVGK